MGNPNEKAQQEYRAITGAQEEEMNEKSIRWGLLPDLLPTKEIPAELAEVSCYYNNTFKNNK